MKLANACYFHLALVEIMFAVFMLNLCNCIFAMKCEMFVNVNARFNGIT